MKKLFLTLLSLVLILSPVSCDSKKDKPISVTEIFHGCDFTITLDRGEYDLGDTLKASVSLTNKSGKEVSLYSPSTAPYFSVIFLENGKLKLNKYIVASDVLCYEPVPNNETYTYTQEFDLDSPFETETLIREDSEWKIKAYGTIIVEENGVQKHEEISAEIIVPH